MSFGPSSALRKRTNTITRIHVILRIGVFLSEWQRPRHTRHAYRKLAEGFRIPPVCFDNDYSTLWWNCKGPPLGGEIWIALLSIYITAFLNQLPVPVPIFPFCFFAKLSSFFIRIHLRLPRGIRFFTILESLERRPCSLPSFGLKNILVSPKHEHIQNDRAPQL